MGRCRVAALPAGLAAWLCVNGAMAQEAAVPPERDRPSQAQQLHEEALKARDAGRFDEAIDRLSRAAELAPDDSDIQVHLGLALAARRRFAAAKAALGKALDRAPDYADARLGLARIAYWTDDLDGADRELRALLGRTPGHPEAKALERRIADARQAARVKASASAGAAEAKQAAARRLAAAQARGRRLLEARAWRLRGSFSEAEQLFRKTLAEEGRNADIWCELGLTLAFAKRHDKALA